MAAHAISKQIRHFTPTPPRKYAFLTWDGADFFALKNKNPRHKAGVLKKKAKDYLNLLAQG
jgi:hypothetical protein